LIAAADAKEMSKEFIEAEMASPASTAPHRSHPLPHNIHIPILVPSLDMNANAQL